MKRLPVALAAAALLIAGCGGSTAPVTHRATGVANGCRTVYGPTAHLLAIQQGLACPDPNSRPSLASGVSTVEQFDDVNVGLIPSSAKFVACYVAGTFSNCGAMHGRVPTATITGISTSTGIGAKCIDLEPGNPPASAAGPWVRSQITKGNPRPCVYSMLSWMPMVKASLAVSHVPHCSASATKDCYLLWDANWTFVRHLDSGFDCTQWTDHALGLSLDESTCAVSFYAKPPPPPPPRIICFGKHPQANATCKKVRAEVAADRKVVHTLTAKIAVTRPDLQRLQALQARRRHDRSIASARAAALTKKYS